MVNTSTEKYSIKLEKFSKVSNGLLCVQQQYKIILSKCMSCCEKYFGSFDHSTGISIKVRYERWSFMPHLGIKDV